MGNESTKLKGIVIDKNVIEATDFWCHYNGHMNKELRENAREISIFQGEPVIGGQLWATLSPLERITNNLKIYRHPCILKYIASWERGSVKYLATESCKSLPVALRSQSDIQICLGLKNVLMGLIFLVEKANVKHLNVCMSAVYITPNNEWRLNGFEYLWKSTEVTKGVLERSQTYRYKNAIDPDEVKNDGENLEQYSYAVLCEEILRRKTSTIPFMDEFKSYCSSHLKHKNVKMRPKLSAVLLHPYFNHEFISIHSFLTELPLKSQLEKQEFFENLLNRLREFDDNMVAIQLGTLLLSRIVLLDEAAQQNLIPFVLRPKTEESPDSLFSLDVFKKHMLPKITHIFLVHDLQIRLILLDHISAFMSLYTHTELMANILPQLLLGIKDTNDLLVANTLRTLADLVPILGSNAVIGTNRSKIFVDGRPHHISVTNDEKLIKARSITPVLTSTVGLDDIPDNVDLSYCSNESLANIDNISEMPRRLSPDGGEDLVVTNNTVHDDDTWSDWESEQVEEKVTNGVETQNETDDNQLSAIQTIIPTKIVDKNVVEDLSSFDIKVQSSKKQMEDDECDFFKDMEPVIDIKKPILSIDTTSKVDTSESNGVTSSRLLAQATDEYGWGSNDDDDDNGWNIDSDHKS